MSITLSSQMDSVFEQGLKVMQQYEEPILQEWENILVHLKNAKGRSFTDMQEAIHYFRKLIFKTDVHEERDAYEERKANHPMPSSTDRLVISFEVNQSFLVLLENAVHKAVHAGNKHSYKDHQAVQYVFATANEYIMTQPQQYFTIETLLQDLTSSNQLPVEWTALISHNASHYWVQKWFNKEYCLMDHDFLKANTMFELTELLLEQMEQEHSETFHVLPLSYENITLLFCIDNKYISYIVPFLTYALKIFQQGHDTINSSRKKQNWKDSVILFNEMLMRSQTYQEAVENITAGFVHYLPFERSALFSYSLNDEEGIGVHGHRLDNEVIRNIAEDTNNLPIIQRNLDFLQHYGKDMKYLQPIFIKDASYGFPDAYVRQFNLRSVVVAPIFTSLDNKLLGAVLLDQGPGQYFQLTQETITALTRFGQSAGEMLSKFSNDIKKQQTTIDQLSPREIDVLELMAAGASTHEAAGELYLSEYTVRDYVSSIMQKMNAQNRTEAVARAIRKGAI